MAKQKHSRAAPLKQDVSAKQAPTTTHPIYGMCLHMVPADIQNKREPWSDDDDADCDMARNRRRHARERGKERDIYDVNYECISVDTARIV